MATTDQPERFYTPYQRREIISKISKRDDMTIMAAADLFKDMEETDPKGLRLVVDKYLEAPPAEED